jgi:GTP-binding protein HflX
VPTGNRLFETLDTTTRLLSLPSKESLLLSDTVGFIRKLPHHLVMSFHATLECVIEADVVVHVVDLGRPTWEHQIATVRSVLDEIGAGGKQEILVFNKVDLVRDQGDLRGALRSYEGALAASAHKGWGIDRLKRRLFELVVKDKREITVAVPAGDGKVLAYIQRYGKVLGSESRGGKLRLRVRMAEPYIKPLEQNIEPDVP